MICRACGRVIVNEQANFCEYCGTRVNQLPINNTAVNDKEVKLGCWLSVLSFLIPLVGFVLYFKYKDTEMEKSKQAARLAWIGVAINIVLMLFF